MARAAAAPACARARARRGSLADRVAGLERSGPRPLRRHRGADASPRQRLGTRERRDRRVGCRRAPIGWRLRARSPARRRRLHRAAARRRLRSGRRAGARDAARVPRWSPRRERRLRRARRRLPAGGLGPLARPRRSSLERSHCELRPGEREARADRWRHFELAGLPQRAGRGPPCRGARCAARSRARATLAGGRSSPQPLRSRPRPARTRGGHDRAFTLAAAHRHTHEGPPLREPLECDARRSGLATPSRRARTRRSRAAPPARAGRTAPVRLARGHRARAAHQGGGPHRARRGRRGADRDPDAGNRRRRGLRSASARGGHDLPAADRAGRRRRPEAARDAALSPADGTGRRRHPRPRPAGRHTRRAPVHRRQRGARALRSHARISVDRDGPRAPSVPQDAKSARTAASGCASRPAPGTSTGA